MLRFVFSGGAEDALPVPPGDMTSRLLRARSDDTERVHDYHHYAFI